MRTIARGPWRWGTAGLVVLVSVGVLRAGPLRLASAPVPPTQEIELLDPGVDPTGKPTAIVRPVAPGVQQIDIPPTVLVHKFYYTGDRSFQGPMLPGGPMIVSVTHPKTQERVYVPVMLPPGAPRVTYTSHAIRYDFGPQSVTLAFGACGKPNVVYSQATQAGDRVREVAQHVSTGAHNLVDRTGIPQGAQQLAQGAKSAVGAGADRVQDAGRAVLRPVVNGLKMLPGAQLFRTSPEDQAARAREAAQRQADRLPPNPDQVFVPRSP